MEVATCDPAAEDDFDLHQECELCGGTVDPRHIHQLEDRVLCPACFYCCEWDGQTELERLPMVAVYVAMVAPIGLMAAVLAAIWFLNWMLN